MIIGQTKDFVQSYKDFVARLEILGCCVQDSGLYECVANNSLGETFTAANLIVKGLCFVGVLITFISGSLVIESLEVCGIRECCFIFLLVLVSLGFGCCFLCCFLWVFWGFLGEGRGSGSLLNMIGIKKPVNAQVI